MDRIPYTIELLNIPKVLISLRDTNNDLYNDVVKFLNDSNIQLPLHVKPGMYIELASFIMASGQFDKYELPFERLYVKVKKVIITYDGVTLDCK